MLNVRKLPESKVGLSLKSGKSSFVQKGEEKSENGLLIVEETEESLEMDVEDVKSVKTLSQNVQIKDSQKLEQQQQKQQQQQKLRIISLDEIAWHDTPDNCWFAIYDYVYDCTSFIRDHPGGDDVLLEYAGRDATLAFIGAGHSKFAQKSLERYLIGELPSNERIFRIAGGVKVYGI